MNTWCTAARLHEAHKSQKNFVYIFLPGGGGERCRGEGGVLTLPFLDIAGNVSVNLRPIAVPSTQTTHHKAPLKAAPGKIQPAVDY